MSDFAQHRHGHRLSRWLVLWVVRRAAPVGLAMLGALGVAAPAAPEPMPQPVPRFAAVRAAHRPSDVWMLDRQGLPLQRLRLDDTVRRFEWVPLERVSPALQAALLTAEDRRFFTHGGVDWAAAARSAWDKLSGMALGARQGGVARGASTLSMQLAALLVPTLQPHTGGRRDLGQKWDQAQAAWAIESQWSKAEIFEAYLNLVPLRGEAVGLSAASAVWFGKRPEGLDLAEAALLAALIRQPQASPQRVGQRACAIVAALDAQTLAAAARPRCSDLHDLARTALTRPHGGGASIALAPHAARVLRGELGAMASVWDAPPGLAPGAGALRSTLDANLQGFVQERLGLHLRELSGRNVEDGAALVLDNASGEVLAWVGSSGDLSDAAAVDGVLALRQAGSTLKPFLYGLALDRQWLTAASLIDDSPVALTAENGVYVPQNYDRHFRGWVSARTALASSLNIPAVRVLLATGTDRFFESLKGMGFGTLTERADHYGLALSLGGADIRLLDLANAYRMLANQGVYTPVAPLRLGAPHSKARRRAMGAGAAFIVGDILSDRGARAPTFGLENPLATRVWSAVKTGTSKDMRDNWAVGFTARYTVAVWVGNFSGAPMWNVSGVQGAAPLWRDIVHFLHDHEPSWPPRVPHGVERVPVQFADITEAPRLEWFLAGTAMREVARADVGQNRPHIVYPADGLIVALDPDLPAAIEAIPLRMQPARAGYGWQLERLSAPPCRMATQNPYWSPQPGQWALRLLDTQGQPVDAVRFSVRGARSASAQDPAASGCVAAP